MTHDFQISYRPMNDYLLKTRKDIVADAIRASILRGTFKPGEKIDQQDIADQLEVSRSPVREAMRTLDAEGLITLIPNRGAVVTERSLRELEELYFTRRLLEGVAIERSVPNMDHAILKKLGSIIEQADETNDPEELLQLNNDFHMGTFNACYQPILLNYTQQLRDMVAPYNRLYLDQAGNKQQAWEDHRRIYAACLERDGRDARVATELHLDRVIADLTNNIKKQRIQV
ncbi:MAG TPA: GntR family transcriptional regulator [Anaerolineales bacterium]